MPDMSSAPVVRLDTDDSILFVNAPWLDLQRETGGRDLSEDDVRGRPFAEFTPDVRLTPVFQFVFRRVREMREPMQVPFRIDAREHRWHMDMHVAALDTGVVECRYATLLVEVPGPDLLTVCAWCQRVRLPAGLWDHRQALFERLDFYLGDAPRVTHGICPSCTAALKGTFRFAE